MDATNTTVKEEPPETAEVFTTADYLLQDVAENGIEMKTFVFDDSNGPTQQMPEASSGPSAVSDPNQSQGSNSAAPLVYRIHHPHMSPFYSRHQEQYVVKELGKRHDLTKNLGQLNRCNGYRMLSTQETPGGILFWRCLKHALFKCEGSAMSRSPHARLVERNPHNHAPSQLHHMVLQETTKASLLQSATSSSMSIQRSVHCRDASLSASPHNDEPDEIRQKVLDILHGCRTVPQEQTQAGPRLSSGSPGLQVRNYRLPYERCTGRYALCEGHRMVSTVRKDNGDIAWKCVHANSLKCRGTATSPKDNEEQLTVTKPHNHPPLILRPKQRIPMGIDKSTLLLPATAGPAVASTPIDLSGISGKQSSTRRRIALCNGYYMRQSYTTKEGLTTWYCCKMISQVCKAKAESTSEKPELVEKRPHSHAPALLYVKAPGRPRKLHDGCCPEVAESKASETAESSCSESSQSSDYTDSDDSSDQEFKPSEGEAFGRRNIPKVHRSRDLLRCDKYAMVEGYGMRCHTAVSTGTSYWQCRHECRFKCKAFAISDLDGSTFKMTQAHNHPPRGDVESYGLLKLRDRWKPSGDSKPPGRPRKNYDKPLSKKNFDLLKCDIFATVDGYLMRCMNVAARKGKSWWFCRVHGRFKCRGSATSDLYGREFVTIHEHNHPPASDGLVVSADWTANFPNEFVPELTLARDLSTTALTVFFASVHIATYDAATDYAQGDNWPPEGLRLLRASSMQLMKYLFPKDKPPESEDQRGLPIRLLKGLALQESAVSKDPSRPSSPRHTLTTRPSSTARHPSCALNVVHITRSGSTRSNHVRLNNATLQLPLVNVASLLIDAVRHASTQHRLQNNATRQLPLVDVAPLLIDAAHLAPTHHRRRK